MEANKKSTWKRLPRYKNGFHRNKENETCEKVQQKEKQEKKKTSSITEKNLALSDNHTLDVTKLGDLVVIERGKDMIYTPV